MSLQEQRSTSLKGLQQQQLLYKEQNKQESVKRIRISERSQNQIMNNSKTSISLIHQDYSIPSQKNDINSPQSIVRQERQQKTILSNRSTQQGFKSNYNAKGFNFSQNNKDTFLNTDSIDSTTNHLASFPLIRENSKALIESNNNVISQLVQSCKKFQINSSNQIPMSQGNMSPKTEMLISQGGSSQKLHQMPEAIHQLFQQNYKINNQLTFHDSKNTILSSNNINQQINNQLHNAVSLQQSTLMKDKLQSLQGLCSPATLSSKKKKKRNDTNEGKTDSATPSSFSSKPEDSYLQLLKKHTSESTIQLINRDSPLRVSLAKQNSFFHKNSYLHNSNSMNKTQMRDSQTYSTAERSLNGLQSSMASQSDKKRATIQEFFTKRIINSQQIQVKVPPFNDDITLKLNTEQSGSLRKTITSTNSLHNKSMSIISYPKLEDISKILQMSVNSAFTDAPRSRADLKELIKWFERVKKQNEEENKYNIEEKRKKQQEIIQVCFKELSHQIKIDFLEREQFFKMVWNENVSYYKSFIEDFEQIRLKINTEADSEFNRVSEFYKQYIKTKDVVAEQAFQEKNIAEKNLEQLKENILQNQQAQTTMKEEINKFKKICMFLKKKLVTVNKEMEGLMQRQEERIRYAKQQMLNDYYKEQLQKYKQDGSQISLSAESTIQSLMEQLKIANESIVQQQKINQKKDNQIDKLSQSQLENQKQQQDVTDNHGEDDDQEGEEDDIFTFEYQEGGDLVQGVDMLNAVIVNTEQEVKMECNETQVDDQLRQMYMRDIGLQTDLYLIDPKFDALMFDVETMNDIFDFYTYKQQMDEQVEKFDPHAFLQTLGEQDQQDNSNMIHTINQLRSMNCIQEEDDKDKKSNASSSSSSSSSSSGSDSSDSETEQAKKKEKQKKSIGSRKSITLQVNNNNFLSVKKDYDNLKGFQQRRSIRQRVSIRQNIFNSNRHLGLYLEQYLGNHFVNDVLAIFSDRIAVKEEQQPNQQQSISLDIPSLLIPPVRTANQRPSFLNSIETNPTMQKKRNELKKKLTEMFEPDKLKQVLDDAGLKVTSTETESKLEKFVKIYQLSQLKGQELQVQLKNTKQVLEQCSIDLQQNNLQLADKETLTEEQKIEIERLEQQIRDLQAELDLKIAQEKEFQLMQNKKSTLTHIEDADQQQYRYRQPRIFKARREKREITAFQLGKKINMEWEFQKQQNSGKQIVEKAKNKKMAKFHNFMTVKTILKQITLLYNERMNITKENSNYKDIEFSNFTYNYYSSQYGVKKIADQKFLILILSVKKYSQVVRINVFGKFLGLQEGSMNYSTEELNKYIDILDFVNNVSQAGTNYVNNESEQKYLVPYIKAVHYISQFGDTRMKVEENQELRKDVEAMKFVDSNKVAVIDFDQYMYRMLAAYRILVNRAKQYVINAFNACDLDGNRKCNFSEWSLLNRHIEPDKFDDDQLVQIFEGNADIIEEDGEKNLSFDKFAVVSLENELFSDETQDRYLEITNPLQIRIKYDNLLQIWQNKKVEIERRIRSLENIEEDAKEDWLNICSVLNDKLITVPFSNSNVKPLLIAYNILDKESQMLEQDNIEYIKQKTNQLITQEDIQLQN